MKIPTRRAPLALACALALGLGGITSAVHAENADVLLQRMEQLEQELAQLKQEVAENKVKAAAASADATAAKAKANKAGDAARVALKDAHDEKDAKIKWHLGGFGFADYTGTNDNQNGGTDNFDGGFNPIFLVSYEDLLLFESELEFTTRVDGSSKLEVEFANLNLLANDALTVTAGKFLSPIGDFQQHNHPTWINKLPDRPAGFMEDGGNEPLTEFGVMARGAFYAGNVMVDYTGFVGNGPQLSDVAEEGVKYEASGGDINNNKAIGGRIGIHPLPYWGVGFSAMHATVAGVEGDDGSMASSADMNVIDFDTAFTKGDWDIRGEYIRSHVDSLYSAFAEADDGAIVGVSTLIPATTWHSWYGQIAYRLSGISNDDLIGKLEPVFRYSQENTKGFGPWEISDESRWTLGVNYWFTPSLVAKFAYENRNYDVQDDANVLRFELGFGF